MFARIRILVSILSVLCALCGQSLAQEWKTVADGVEYAEVRREFSGKPVNINLLRLDLKKVRLDVHHAMDAAIGTEKTSSIAKRHKAFAAINAGFFRLDTSIWAGDAAGFLMIDRMIWSESTNDRVALLIEETGNVARVGFAHINLNYHLTIVPKKWKLKDSRNYFISGVNRERKENEVIVYTATFHRTTLTNADGLEIIFDEKGSSQILDNHGNSVIPADGFVVSASGEKRAELLRLISKGTGVVLSSGVSVVDVPGKPQESVIFAFSKIDDAVAGVPQLIKNSRIDITWEQEKSSKAFVETRHPRTAVAKLKDGKFLMLTADGRTDQSAGLDLYDLAAYFLELGATDAMNLDGGGSTTMFLDGKVVNKPSDKEGERKVGDAILVTLRKPAKRK